MAIPRRSRPPVLSDLPRGSPLAKQVGTRDSPNRRLSRNAHHRVQQCPIGRIGAVAGVLRFAAGSPRVADVSDVPIALMVLSSNIHEPGVPGRCRIRGEPQRGDGVAAGRWWRGRYRAVERVGSTDLLSKGGYADIGITSFMPIGALCRVDVVAGTFRLLLPGLEDWGARHNQRLSRKARSVSLGR